MITCVFEDTTNQRIYIYVLKFLSNFLIFKYSRMDGREHYFDGNTNWCDFMHQKSRIKSSVPQKYYIRNILFHFKSTLATVLSWWSWPQFSWREGNNISEDDNNVRLLVLYKIDFRNLTMWECNVSTPRPHKHLKWLFDKSVDILYMGPII